VRAHHLLERADRLLAADEERHDHVREDDDVAQRQDGERTVAARQSNLLGFGHFRLFPFVTAPGRAGGLRRSARRRGERLVRGRESTALFRFSWLNRWRPPLMVSRQGLGGCNTCGAGITPPPDPADGAA